MEVLQESSPFQRQVLFRDDKIKLGKTGLDYG